MFSEAKFIHIVFNSNTALLMLTRQVRVVMVKLLQENIVLRQVIDIVINWFVHILLQLNDSISLGERLTPRWTWIELFQSLKLIYYLVLILTSICRTCSIMRSSWDDIGNQSIGGEFRCNVNQRCFLFI